METKILDFKDISETKAELWGSFTDVPIKLACGIAHAYTEDDLLILCFYEPSGLSGSTGEIKRLSARVAIPQKNIIKISSQISEIIQTFIIEKNDTSNNLNNASSDILPEIGDRIY